MNMIHRLMRLLKNSTAKEILEGKVPQVAIALCIV